MQNPKNKIVETLNVDYSKTYSRVRLYDLNSNIPVNIIPLDNNNFYKIIIKNYYRGFILSDPSEMLKISECGLLKYSDIGFAIETINHVYYEINVPVNNYSSKDLGLTIDGNEAAVYISFSNLNRGDHGILTSLQSLYMLTELMFIAYPKSHYDLQTSENAVI